MDFEIDVITHIPDEIKLLIFQHLDSFSVITLENVSKKFAELSFDKKLSSNLCFYMNYRFKLIHLQSFLLHKLRKEIITSLNINCVYWIPKDQMKGCLSLHMLTSLYALDTNLDLSDICCANLPNLNVLAITEHFGYFLHFQTSSVLKNLKKLYIQHRIMLIGSYLPIMDIFNNCINLEELWLLGLCINWSLRFGINTTNSLKRFVTTSNVFTNFTDWHPTRFNAVTFKSERAERSKENICLENTNMNISNIYTRDFYESPEKVLWATYLNELKCDYPFGYRDAKKLVNKQETLDSIYFEELSLTHRSNLCCEKLQSTVVSILALPNTKLLKKLSINICIFYDHGKTKERLIKRRRVTEVCMKRSTLDVIVEHLPLLEELEILVCTIGVGLNGDVLRSIGKLLKLKSLVLYNISETGNGKYLRDICKSCANLTSLKIWALYNSDLNIHFCMSLRYLRMLKDLRCEQPYLPLDRILESLTSNKSPKLERLVLMCNRIDTFSSKRLKKFITHNPQLQLLFISINNFSEAEYISRELIEMKSDQQIFIITNDESVSFHLLPQVHVLEMLQFNTSIGVIHPFNDFH